MPKPKNVKISFVAFVIYNKCSIFAENFPFFVFLAKHYGIDVEDSIAVGDQWNDLSMIERAGLGVAVNNADEKLKRAADITLPLAGEDGAVADMIEKYAYLEE